MSLAIRRVAGAWLAGLALAACVATAPMVETLMPTPAPTGIYMNTDISNPVFDHDFPDPDVLRVGDTYYAYATNNVEFNIQAARSTDLVRWELLGEALPALPAWAVPEHGWTWAPDVTASAEGGPYLMYFTTRFALGTAGGGIQCIGVATSATPEGPFTPWGELPLICPVGKGGAIDPATFVDDDGTRYLLWKNDGNSGGGRTYIYLQTLAQDGLSFLTDPLQVLEVDQRWEGAIIEGPSLWKRDGRYYLFYSANDYKSPRYAIGVAVADEIRGPYTKAAGPLLETQLKAGIVGPGGQDVVVGPNGDTWLAFHDWTAEGTRSLNVLPLAWDAGWPVVELGKTE